MGKSVRVTRAVFLGMLTTSCGQPFWHPRPAEPEPPFPEPATPAAIQELSLERGPCMDTSCPAYRYTFRRDGRATYDSLSSVTARLVRRSTATLDSVTFAALAVAILERGFFGLQPRYSTGGTDAREVTVRALVLDTAKTVVEEEATGPPALHVLQLLLDSAGTRLSWRVVPPSK